MALKHILVTGVYLSLSVLELLIILFEDNNDSVLVINSLTYASNLALISISERKLSLCFCSNKYL